MSVRVYSLAPYYDDYNPDKDYVQVLCVSGNYVQAREFTQIGTMYRDFMERLGGSIFSSGQILSGCTLIIDHENKKATISEGSIYLEGLVRKLRKPLEVSITGTGEEKIGVKIFESVITALDDASLRNPAVGTDGFNTEGASRVKQTVVATVNDDSAVTLFTLENGEVKVETTNVETDIESQINNKLAQRTYDVSGNFKVEGLYLESRDTLILPASDPDYGKSQIYVGAGRAYIQGYHVKYASMRLVDCEIPRDNRLLRGEPHIFNSISDKFYFAYNPVMSVENVSSHVKKQKQITKGVSGGQDYIADNIATVESVVQGSKVYVRGEDYNIAGNYIDWYVPGEEPASGSTYVVTYTYVKNNVENVDYTIGDDSTDGTKKYIQFKTTAEESPIKYTEITVDYKFYLSRIDTYTMNSKGEINIIKGVPAVGTACIAPRNNDPTALTLGYVYNFANSTNKNIKNLYSIRLTQSDIYQLRNRIDNMEYNIAVLDLDREAREGEDATELKGVYTDGFMGFTKSDITHPLWNCSVDISRNELVLPFEASYQDMAVNKTASYCDIKGRIVSAPYTSVLALSQPLATTQFLVNPYAVYRNLSTLTLDPSKDTWTSSQKVTIDGETTSTSASLRRWWYHKGESWAEEEKARWYALTGTSGEQLGYNNYSGTTSSSYTQTTTEVITYMRGRLVKIVGMNFNPSEYPIKLTVSDREFTPIIPASSGPITRDGYTFDLDPKGEKEVEISPKQFIDGSYSVVGKEYVRANEDGIVEAYFELPDNAFPCGTVDVKLQGPYTLASTSYEANGTRETVTTVVRQNRVVIETVDPLAQTFSFDKDTVVTKFDLFFAQKDYSRGIVIQVRDVVNGYPGTTILSEKAIPSELVNADNTALVATPVELDQTVFCEKGKQYALVILSDSNLYKYWVADLGEVDITSKIKVNSNPYLEGVMFSSSNGIAWTAHQSSDLALNIYRANYTRDGEVVFDNVSVGAIYEIIAGANIEDQRNDGVTWEIKLGTGEWRPINTFSSIDVVENESTVYLKATIHCTPNTSPVIAKDEVTLGWLVGMTSGTYISREIQLSDDFSRIKISYQSCEPEGSSVRAFYQCSEISDAWNPVAGTDTTKVINAEFTQHNFEIDLPRPCTKYRVRLDLSTEKQWIKPRVRKLMSILRD